MCLYSLDMRVGGVPALLVSISRSRILLSASVGFAGRCASDGGKGVRTLVERHCSFACASSRFTLFVSFLSLIVGVGYSG